MALSKTTFNDAFGQVDIVLAHIEKLSNEWWVKLIQCFFDIGIETKLGDGRSLEADQIGVPWKDSGRILISGNWITADSNLTSLASNPSPA